jgi:hypothetical protein
LPMDVFDRIRASVLADRSQFFKDLSAPFYGANRPGAKVSQGLRDSFWLQGMQAGFKGVFDCIKAFSETDQTDDLRKLTVPTLFDVHLVRNGEAPGGVGEPGTAVALGNALYAATGKRVRKLPLQAAL